MAFEVLLGLVEADPVAERPEHRPGGHVSGSRHHHQARQRGEAHRGVDRPPRVHRSERRPRTDVRGHQARRGQRATEQLGSPHARPRVAEAVEAEATDPELFAPAPRQRVGRGLPRERRVEARVEAGDLHEPRPAATELVDGCERRRVVQRRQVRQAPELSVGLRVDDEWLDEFLAAVDDAMPDGVGRRRGVEEPFEGVTEGVVPREVALAVELVGGDELIAVAEQGELQTARACVHDEHAHSPTLPEPPGTPRICEAAC